VPSVPGFEGVVQTDNYSLKMTNNPLVISENKRVVSRESFQLFLPLKNL